jgi:hypothetical protein
LQNHSAKQTVPCDPPSLEISHSDAGAKVKLAGGSGEHAAMTWAYARRRGPVIGGLL